MKIRALATFSSRGGRPVQEDYVVGSDQKGLFAIADGFGGPGPGATAAKTACEAVKSFLIKEAGDLEATLPFELRNYFSLAGNVLFNALIHANRKVQKMNHGKPPQERGGASVLAGFVDGSLLALANVGACSAWLIRDNQMVELVIPRTYARLAEPFSTDLREELKCPLIALGMGDHLEPEIFEYRLYPGDWLFFQTDGVPESIRNDLLAARLQNQPENQVFRQIQADMESAPTGDNLSGLLAIL
ncbi:MAG: protein phosphatase 2C domain-containing protein [Bdellovibrionota bacterium]